MCRRGVERGGGCCCNGSSCSVAWSDGEVQGACCCSRRARAVWLLGLDLAGREEAWREGLSRRRAPRQQPLQSELGAGEAPPSPPPALGCGGQAVPLRGVP